MPDPDPMTTPPTGVSALTAQWVLDNMLPGLPLVSSQGVPLSAGVINGRIKGTVRGFERKYGVRLSPTTIKVGTDRLERDPPAAEPDPIHERYRGLDYHPDGNLDNRHHVMHLPVGPIRSIIGVGLRLPGMFLPATLPVDWISYQPRSNTIRLYPQKSLSFAVVYTGGYFLNIHAANKPIPEAWHITYEAGYGDSDLGGRDYDILEALGKMVAIEVLVPGSLDTYLAQGISGKSISADGLSQSIQLLHHPNGLKYSNVIARLTEEIAAWESTFWARRGGVRLAIL
jgi:hypothetical protein